MVKNGLIISTIKIAKNTTPLDLHNLIDYIHYEKLCLPKPHCPTTRAQTTICTQLLCNYPLNTITIMQLFPLKYKELINKLSQ